MSTIGGLLNTKDNIDPSAIMAMRDAMHNKYSDYDGIWISESVGMFCNLLYTTQESKHEVLPLNDSIYNCTITADARIDNRPELIALLEISTDSSVPLTDGELILQAYLTWGEECVNHLIGDFAFAIWDTQNQKLFCARDHLGIRPFYYYHKKDNFVFASGMESVIRGGRLTKKPNCKVLQEIIDDDVKNFSSTVFENITRLLPAHTLTVQKGEIHIKRYWFPEKIPMNHALSKEDAVSGFISIMKRSISDRMRSAYPVGCELSGGLDSSTVLTLVNEITSSQPLYTFACTYGDLPCDESSYINDVSNKLNIEPIYIQADKLDYHFYNLDLFYSINKEWPGSGSFLESFKEFESAKEYGVRVLLTGQGGDHITAGGNVILSDYLREGRLIRLFRMMKHLSWNKNVIRRYLILPFLSEKVRFVLGYIFKKNLTPETSLYGLDTNASFLSFSQKKELELLYHPFSLLWQDSNPYIQLSEHYGIECRHPFFDKRVVEYMIALPSWYKYDGDFTKIIIRLAMQERFPLSILNRKDKAEFTPALELQMKSFKPLDLKNIILSNCLRKDILYLKNKIAEKWNLACIVTWFDKNFKN